MEYGIGDILRLFGSLGLFLYGMKTMSDALMEVAGHRMRKILSTMTSNRVFAVFTGFLITAAIQSSSATTLMVVSFVNASLLTLTEAVGVILGANIGTTVTAWLITILGFKVSMSALAIPLVGAGFLMSFSKKEQIKNWGNFIIGFAILFIGLQFLKDSIPDIKSNPQILEFLKNYTDLGFASVLIFLVIGTLLTIIVQSSSATMALTLLMCHEGWIPYEIAAAMVLGENIGTTITANLAALVGNFHAKRAARAHFVVNIIGVTVVLIFFYPFLRLVSKFAMLAGGASPFEQPEAIPVSLSLFHTCFNVANMLLLLGFVPLIVALVIRLIPEKVEEEKSMAQAKYLTKASLKYPQTGVRALLDETTRLFENIVYKVIVHGLNAHRSDIESGRKLKEIVSDESTSFDLDIDEIYYNQIKNIYGSIVQYATDLQSKHNLKKDQIELIRNVLVANRNIVEVVKNMKALHRNITTYTNSDNAQIKAEYNSIRKMILKVLREINEIENSDGKDLEIRMKKLEKLRNKSKKSDVLISGRIDKLIRDKAITDDMASSLMNDSVNAIEMCQNLTRHAELLYADKDSILEDLPVDAELLTGHESILTADELIELHKTYK